MTKPKYITICNDGPSPLSGPVPCQAACWSFAQARSRELLNCSVLDGAPLRCLRNRLVRRQNLIPAAMAKTAQGTSIQRGLLIAAALLDQDL